MLKKFIPDVYQKSIFTIDYKSLKNRGIKCILFDLDNTVSPARQAVYSKDVKKLFEKLKKDFKIILFSNNLPSRIRPFGEYYKVDYACVSLKPLAYKYRYIIKKYGYKKDELAAVGDQLLTDILGGNKIGITTILVDPLSKIDERETFINRKIENLILKNFEKNGVLKKGKYYE